MTKLLRVRTWWIVATVLLALTTKIASGAVQASQMGRVDAEIAQSVQKLLLNKPAYRDVTFGVDDAVVVLSGTVELFSDRQNLARDVLRIKKVARVENLIVLTPPAIDDAVLLGRVSDSLSRFEEIRITAHEGLVVLSGTVRDYSEYGRALMAAWSTPGVREVQGTSIRIISR